MFQSVKTTRLAFICLVTEKFSVELSSFKNSSAKVTCKIEGGWGATCNRI